MSLIKLALPLVGELGAGFFLGKVPYLFGMRINKAGGSLNYLMKKAPANVFGGRRRAQETAINAMAQTIAKVRNKNLQFTTTKNSGALTEAIMPGIADTIKAPANYINQLKNGNKLTSKALLSLSHEFVDDKGVINQSNLDKLVNYTKKFDKTTQALHNHTNLLTVGGAGVNTLLEARKNPYEEKRNLLGAAIKGGLAGRAIGYLGTKGQASIENVKPFLHDYDSYWKHRVADSAKRNIIGGALADTFLDNPENIAKRIKFSDKVENILGKEILFKRKEP